MDHDTDKTGPSALEPTLDRAAEVAWQRLLWVTTRIEAGSRSARWIEAAAGRAERLDVFATHRVKQALPTHVELKDRVASPTRIRSAVAAMKRHALHTDAAVVQGPALLFQAVQSVLAGTELPIVRLRIDKTPSDPLDPLTFTPGPVADADLFAPAERHGAETVRVLTHGPMVREGHWVEAMEVFALAAQAKADLELELLGVGEVDVNLLQELRRRRSALPTSLGARINIVTGISESEVAVRLRKADLYLDLAAGQELDRALLEALSCQLQVLSNNWAARELSDELPGILPLTGVESARQVGRNALILESASRHLMPEFARAPSRRYILEHHSFEAFARRLDEAIQRATLAAQTGDGQSVH